VSDGTGDLPKSRHPEEVSPFKSLAEELVSLRRFFGEVLQNYAARVEGELEQVHETVLAAAQDRRKSGARLRDVRDMITLLRTLELRPEKGRRRDLKRIEGILDDLRGFVDGW
jgi:hypothetical protein